MSSSSRSHTDTRFDASDLSVRLAHPREIGWMLHKHYLDKWPAVSTALIALCRRDVPVGCIVFAEAPRETSRRYGGHTWELARLWVRDEEPRNTESWFIARAVKLIRHHRTDIRFLVSYADPSAGHRGTIYRAANWCPDGFTDEERQTPRFDYEANGVRYSRKSHVPTGCKVSRVPRVSKARFVLELT